MFTAEVAQGSGHPNSQLLLVLLYLDFWLNGAAVEIRTQQSFPGDE
jgi:hypothetical protein